MEKFCPQCHATVSPDFREPACPACGATLASPSGSAPDRNLDLPGAPPREVDHRGILLPRRHAVGGIITPR